MNNSLRDQQAVERIRMNPREPACQEGAFLVDLQTINAAGLTRSWHEYIRPLRYRELAARVFDGDLPSGSWAKIAFIGPVEEGLRTSLTQPRKI